MDHRIQRYNESGDRLCSGCRKYKNVSEFHKDKNVKDGLAKRCKDCIRKYQSEHIKKMVATSMRWQQEHPERQKEIHKKYYQANKDKIYVAHFKYLREHPGKKCQNKRNSKESSRKWRLEHVEESRRYASKYLKTHPEVSVTRAENRRARKLGNGGTFTTKEWQQLKEKYNFTCLCCGRKEPEIALTRDHVLPLVMGGRNVIENIQPLCKPCNSAKHTKHIDYRPWWDGKLF